FSDKRVKYYDTSAEYITSALDNSLQEMQIEHVDLLLVHRPDPFMDHQETGAALDALVASGKIGSIGVSNFKAHDWNLLQSAMKNKLVTNQIEISPLEISAFSNGDIAFLQQEGIKPMAWSPLGGGALFDASNEKGARVNAVLSRIAKQYNVGLDAVAFAWLLKHPSSILPVVGTNNLSRIKSLSDTLKVEMDRETWFEIYTASLGHEVA
ncbi:MAG: aldo/keto reductase family oxidoreductase, partial [Nitratireductor sp.]